MTLQEGMMKIMHNFLTLYGYELKKIFKRRIVLNTLVILTMVVLYVNIAGPLGTMHSWSDDEGNIITMNGFEWIADQKAKTEELNGQIIDDTLLDKVKEAYKGVYRAEYSVQTNDGSGYGYRQTFVELVDDEEDEESAAMKADRQRSQDIYQPIYYYIQRVTGFYDNVHTVDADFLYQTRQEYLLETEWAHLMMTDKEKEYWIEREDDIERPFTYNYAGSWNDMLDNFIYINMVLVLAIVICLSNVFSDEHLKRTDQQILCSKHGKGRFYFAKTAAGLTFGVICSVFMFLVFVVSDICVYGPEGSSVVVQLYRPLCSRGLTMGQAVFLLGGFCIILGIVYSILAMFLSEAVKNAVAVMAIMTGGMLLTMLIQIPYQHRAISQVYSLLPTRILNVEQLWDGRLLTVLGLHLTNYQTAVILYIVTGALLIWRGNRIWQRIKN